MAISLGRNAKAYYMTAAINLDSTALNSAGLDTALAAGTVYNQVIDLSIELDTELVDVTTRDEAEHGFGASHPVLHSGRVTFEVPYDTANTTTAALLTAWKNMTGIAFAFMSAALASDVEGLVGNFGVSLSKSENARDIQRLSVTLTPKDNCGWHVHN